MEDISRISNLFVIGITEQEGWENKSRHLLSGYYMPDPVLNSQHVFTCLILIQSYRVNAIIIPPLQLKKIRHKVHLGQIMEFAQETQEWTRI